MQRKIYRAISPTTCEKGFLEDWDNKPDDWHWTTADALDAFAPKPRRGRPPKAAIEGEAVEEAAEE